VKTAMSREDVDFDAHVLVDVGVDGFIEFNLEPADGERAGLSVRQRYIFPDPESLPAAQK
jgi:hypothetical protein